VDGKLLNLKVYSQINSMSILTVCNLLGASITTGLGCMGLFAPHAAARFTGLKALNPTGFSEFRATYGGIFLALGAALWITREPLLYQVIGVAWIAAAVGRIVSVFADHAKESRNFQAVAFETTIGILLIMGNI
ncbi:MAG: DUF4345 family protein, partial [Flammeovirgaceae bacterium]